MAKKKPLKALSSDELYALAQQREEEEAEAEREANRQAIEDLKAQRKAMVAAHKKALSDLDKQIRQLGGKTPPAGRGKKINVTDTIEHIVQTAGEISTKEIRAALESQGIDASNLAQTLAYLKRQGRVGSPSRAIYTPA
jgi:aspartokinase